MTNLLNIDAVVKSKKQNLGTSVAVLLLAAVLFTASGALAWWVLDQPAAAALAGGTFAVFHNQPLLNAVAGVFLVVFLGGLFLAFIHKSILKNLGGKGGYGQGLTAVAYSAFPVSLGSLLAAIVGWLPLVGGLPLIALQVLQFVAFILFAVLAAWGFSAFYRASKDLFAVDAVTSFIGVALLALVLATAMGVTPLGASLVNAVVAGPVGLPGWGLPVVGV